MQQRWITPLVAFVLVCAPSPAWAQSVQPALHLTADGRTLNKPPDFSSDTPIRIAVQRPQTVPTLKCPGGSIQELVPAGPPVLRYKWLPAVVKPHLLATGATDAEIADPDNWNFTIPRTTENKGAPFLVVNMLSRVLAIAGGDLKSCAENVKTLVEQWVAETKFVTASLRTNRARLAVVKGHIDALKASETPEAVARVVELQKEVDTLQEAITKATQPGSIKASPLGELAPTAAAATELLDLMAAAPENSTKVTWFAVKKIFGLAVDPTTKTMYYDFADLPSGSAVGLAPLGSWPVVHQDDAIYAVVANVIPEDHAYGFVASVDASAGSAVNVAPVRPVFGSAAGGPSQLLAAAPPPKSQDSTDPVEMLTGEERAYTDFFLPIQGEFAPNDILAVTIRTQAPSADDPDKLAEVVFVDKAKYPQVRAKYRFNFNLGVIAADCHKCSNQDYTKVQTVVDDPETDADEARYEVLAKRRHPEVTPVFAFTFYWKPVDIRGPINRWPQPVIGFSLTEPTKDFFVGASIEVVRNAQLVLGYRWAPIQERLSQDPFDERDAAAPKTRDKRAGWWFAGFTFNLSVVGQIFQR